MTDLLMISGYKQCIICDLKFKETPYLKTWDVCNNCKWITNMYKDKPEVLEKASKWIKEKKLESVNTL